MCVCCERGKKFNAKDNKNKDIESEWYIYWDDGTPMLGHYAKTSYAEMWCSIEIDYCPICGRNLKEHQ